MLAIVKTFSSISVSKLVFVKFGKIIELFCLIPFDEQISMKLVTRIVYNLNGCYPDFVFDNKVKM